MPHMSVKLRPGVDQNETPALNEAGIQVSQLIRFIPDKTLGALVQKLGGWTKYYNSAMAAVVRALWGWEDTNLVTHLAVGTQNKTNTYQAQLSVITANSLTDITPRSITDNVTPAVSSTVGSSIFTITDATVTNITFYDTVYIPVHISIGGVILFGLYQTDPNNYISPTQFTVQALDIFGNPQSATATSTSPTVPSLATTSGSSNVNVTLANHGYSVGSTFPILCQTTVGGITFFGNYTVQSVTSSSVFVISATNTASATTSASLNGGLARYIYGFGVGSIPTGTGFGVGGFGTGGFGAGTAIIPTSGTPISSSDWTLDNWGSILLACPIVPPTVLTTTSASGTGTVGTLNFSPAFTVDVGESITVSGMVPTSWNGTYVVTASSSSSVSFATTVTASQTVAGTITVNASPYAPIYAWDPTSGSPTATVIQAGPPVNDGMFVAMPQRQIICWGSSFTGVQDPLLLRWCDVNNYSTTSSWVAQITNQAGSYRLPKGSKIVGGLQGPQQAFIWTDLAIWSMQYVGQPYVYSFNEIGTGCGLIGRKAAQPVNGVIYWMGPSQFFKLDGSGVSPVFCPIWDVIFQQLDTSNASKIRCAVNSRFGEVTWYYPTLSSGGEVTAYAKYNVNLEAWDYGTLGRSAWIDQSVLGPPIGADPSLLYLYQHETSNDADGQAMVSYFTTGYFALSDGDYKMFVDEIWPDMKWATFSGTQSATVNMTLNATDFAGTAPNSTALAPYTTAYGPYGVTQSTQWVNPRIRTRLMSMTIGSSDVGSFWRIANIRYRGQPDGRY